MQVKTIIFSAIFGLAVLVSAHPGEHEKHNPVAELKTREYKANLRRGLEKCAPKLEANGFYARAAKRRAATVEAHRKRKLVRDTTSVLNTSHHYNGTVTLDTPETVLFQSNNTCILNPEGETGPFWVKGELIRADVSDGEEGVQTVLDGQFVDVETCEPIVGLYWDVWNCNSTGVYSGVTSAGNGNSDDTSNLDATFLRGLQPTDDDGVAQFQTVFPGHYAGRTTHIHVVAHLNATVLPNNTLTGGSVAHIGQLFFDQDLIEEVEATSPYSTNTIAQTSNADDRVFQDETENTSSDPVIEYVLLGDDLSDGLFGWITIAVNTSATYDPNYSFVYTANGSVADSGGSGGAGGGPGGNGTSTGIPGNSTGVPPSTAV